MPDQNTETHRRSQFTNNPDVLAPFRRRNTPEQVALAAYIYWFAQALIARWPKDATVVMHWHPSWDLPPEWMTVPVENEAADRNFKRHLACFGCHDLWFTVERAGVQISTDIIPERHRTMKRLARLTQECIDDVELMQSLRRRYALQQLDDWREITIRRRAVVRHLVMADTSLMGDRSGIMWKIARTCAEAGCTRSEIATVVAASKAYQSKHGKWNERVLEPLINKVQPYDTPEHHQ